MQFGANPLDTDLLESNRHPMVGLGMAMLATLGSGTYADGLACTPGTGLSVNIGPGSIYTLAAIDATPYGSLPADTIDQIVQQGIVFGQNALSCPAPGTAGQSINYLVEAQYQQVDVNPVQLLYYNSDNPLQPLLGTATNTERKSVCALQIKAGTAAATGAQTTPSVDSGWVPLYVVTVANGATSVVSGNISLAAGAPFIQGKVGHLFQVCAGNPNGVLAGSAGVAGTAMASLVWDTTDTVLWVCTTTGTASTAVWTKATGALSGLGLGLGVKNDGAGNLTLNLADGSMRLTAAGVQANEPITPLSGSVNVATANHFANFVGGGTLNLPLSSTLWNGFCFAVSANSGLVTLNPNAADAFNGSGAGGAYTLQQGSTALFITDAAGNWWIFNLSLPVQAPQGSPYNYAYLTGFVI